MTPPDATRLTSFILRIFWYLYPILTGRPFSLDELHSEKNKRIAKDLVEKFLPDLRKMTGTKTKKKGLKK